MVRLLLFVARDGDDQVEHLEIEPDNGERETERRLPFILLRQLVGDDTVDGIKVADQEQRRDDDEDDREADGEQKVVLHRLYQRLCERDERRDDHQQRYADHGDEQRHHDGFEFLGDLDDPLGIQDCHHQYNDHSDHERQKTEIFLTVEHLEDQKRDEVSLRDAV